LILPGAWRSDLFPFCCLITQGTPVNIIVGSHVWLEDPSEAWVDGVVTEIKGRDATIATTNGKTVRSPSPHSTLGLFLLFHRCNRVAAASSSSP